MSWIATAIIGSAVIGAGAAIIGGNKAASAATQSAEIQAQAARDTAQVQQDIFNTTRNDLHPFVTAGTAGLANYASLLNGGLSVPNADTINLPANTSFVEGTGYVTQNDDGSFSVSQTPPEGSVTKNAPTQLGATPDNSLAAVNKFMPGSYSSAEENILRSLTPGAIDANPLMTAANSFVPGANTTPNALLKNLESFNGNSDSPDASLSALRNFTPGGSATPDNTLTILRSFIPGGGSDNNLLKQYEALLGVGKDGTFDPKAIQAALEATPGYQFTRDQGQKAVQNSYAAKGLGSSGAAMRGAADYATGLAGQTYEQRLQDYLSGYNNEFTNTYNAYTGQATNALNTYNNLSSNALNSYNIAGNLAYNTWGQGATQALNQYSTKLTGAQNTYQQRVDAAKNLLSVGENAGAQTGQIGSQTGQAIGNTLTSGAAAQAAGIVGAANAQTGALTNVANSIGNAGVSAALLSQNGNNLSLNYNSPYTNQVDPRLAGLFR